MKSFVNRIVLALMLGLVVSVSAQAQFTWTQRTVPELPGFVVNDLFITPQTTNPIMEMLLAAPGAIYQDPDQTSPFIAVGAPPLEPTPVPETLNSDSYVTMGAESFVELPAGLLIAGGAVDIGGGMSAVFDEDLADIGWAPGSGMFLEPTGVERFVARLTLADTFNSGSPAEGGGITVYLLDGTGNDVSAVFPISGGAVVPEPSSMAMLALGLLGFLRRRV